MRGGRGKRGNQKVGGEFGGCLAYGHERSESGRRGAFVRSGVRGDALRHSLYFTFIAWIPGAFWMGATGATAMTPLGKYLGATDLIFAMIYTGGPMLAVLFQLPGARAVEHL